MMGLMVLPADIQIVPLGELPPQVRSQIQGDDGDFALTRPRSRTPSKVVDLSGKLLIEQFREPSTIVDAIVRYSKTRQVKAADVLEDAYPLIHSLLAAKLLVEPGADAEAISAKLERGERFGEWEVIDTVQVLVDSELHRVKNEAGQTAALKLLREAAPKHVRRAFEHEAGILRLLGEGIAPRLIAADESHVITEWCEGADADRGVAGRPDLCVAIADAYARLHACGVLHGDVHPRNVLVDEAGAVRLIDFGLARRLDAKGHAPARGGVAYFNDPEMAAASRRGAPPPPVTPQSEQYSVAALLYYLLAGRHYLDFSVEREEMLRQIAEEPPNPLGQSADPVLMRALDKNPAGRYASMAEFAEALRRAIDAPPVAGQDNGALRACVDTWLAKFDDPDHPPEYVGPASPIGSVTYGAAGVAYALLRIAQSRDDARLLALADRWADRAASLAGDPSAFYHDAVQITPEVVGRVSPYHSETGIVLVNALTAHAFGDVYGFERAVNRFLELSAQPCENLDITLGRSGSVLAASLLLDAWNAVSSQRPDGLVEFGNRTIAGVWAELAQLPSIREERKIGYTGMAHGWAGFAYAALRWRKSAGGQLAPGVEQRMAELAELAQPTRYGVQWPFRLQARDAFAMKGWCNGGAGQVFLWTLAHQLLGDGAFGKLAETTALDVFHTPMQIDSLCCGLAGAGYSMLAMYKHTGESAWLERARTLAGRALHIVPRGEQLPHSLYKGQVGVAVLAAELERPEFASMPMFEERRWPVER